MIRSIPTIPTLEVLSKMSNQPSCYTCSRIFRIGTQTKECLQNDSIAVNYISHGNSTSSSTAAKENDGEEEKPVVFTKSKAFNTKPGFLNPKYDSNGPKYQNASIFISLSCFCVYFFLLREENDYDQLLDTSLYDRIEGLEKASVLASIRYNEKNGLDTTDLKRKLDTLVAEEETNKAECDQKEKVLSDFMAKTK